MYQIIISVSNNNILFHAARLNEKKIDIFASILNKRKDIRLLF